jgi:hypothetical protein
MIRVPYILGVQCPLSRQHFDGHRNQQISSCKQNGNVIYKKFFGLHSFSAPPEKVTEQAATAWPRGAAIYLF